MKTFKDFLTEAKDDSRNVLGRIKNFTHAGELTKREYDELKYEFNRFIEKEVSEPVKKEHWYGSGDKLYNIAPELGALGYDIPHSYIEVLSLKNKLKKVSHIKHKLIDDLQKIYDEYSEAATALKALKDKIVSAAAKREVAKVAKEVASKKKFVDSASLVNELMQNIEEYENRAYELAGEQYDNILEPLKKAKWDIDVAAPTPDYKIGKEAYRAASAKRTRFMQLTKAKSASAPNIRHTTAEIKQKYQDTHKKAAHDSYIAWIGKMIEKIGSPVVAATAKGDPWTGSTLTVTTKDGETQVWHTQMIINRSKYNELFNQFPSRRKK